VQRALLGQNGHFARRKLELIKTEVVFLQDWFDKYDQIIFCARALLAMLFVAKHLWGGEEVHFLSSGWPVGRLNKAFGVYYLGYHITSYT